MFLVCGEALFDVFIEDGTALDESTIPFSARVGGSPFNVALGLARLGYESALMTGLSTDFFGDRLQAVLEKEKVSTRFLARKHAPTTLGFVQKDENGIPSYAFYGEGAADRSLTIDDVSVDLAGVSCIHIGSYSIVVSPTADSLQELLLREAGNRILSLDPNIRPTVEPDLAQWRERVAKLIKLVDVVKASDEDLAWLYPDVDPELILQGWIASGVKLAVLTKGHKGAVLMSYQARVEVETPLVEVTDTVGAGDTFQAALLSRVVSLDQDCEGEWALQLDSNTLNDFGCFAATAASITCTRQGADLPMSAEINDVLAKAS